MTSPINLFIDLIQLILLITLSNSSICAPHLLIPTRIPSDQWFRIPSESYWWFNPKALLWTLIRDDPSDRWFYLIDSIWWFHPINDIFSSLKMRCSSIDHNQFICLHPINFIRLIIPSDVIPFHQFVQSNRAALINISDQFIYQSHYIDVRSQSIDPFIRSIPAISSDNDSIPVNLIRSFPIIDQFFNPIDDSISSIPSDRWFDANPIGDSMRILSVIQSESYRWFNPNPIGDSIRILLVIQSESDVELVCQTNMLL